MAGHKRPHGVPVCPIFTPLINTYRSEGSEDYETDDSSQLTPTNSSVFSEAGPSNPPLTPTDSIGSIPTEVAASFHGPIPITFNPPSKGPWHWPNPNWVDKKPSIHPAIQHVQGRDDDASSVVSTEVVESSIVKVEEMLLAPENYEHGNGLYTQHLDRQPSYQDIIQLMAQNQKPCVNIYSVALHEAEKQAIATHARETGYYIEIHLNAAQPQEKRDNGHVLCNVYWVVVGRDANAVSQLSHRLSRQPTQDFLKSRAGSNASNILQMISAGVIGAIVVLGGLSLM
jgi:hypothetical protein